MLMKESKAQNKWKGMLFSWIKTLNTVKMPILKIICQFNSILSQPQKDFFEW